MPSPTDLFRVKIAIALLFRKPQIFSPCLTVCKINLNENKLNQNELVLVSDAFFPFPDSIDLIAEAGIKWVVQPGGSIKDADVIARAKEKNINLILTGQRHFRH